MISRPRGLSQEVFLGLFSPHIYFFHYPVFQRTIVLRQLCQVRSHIHLDASALKWLHFARHIEAHFGGKRARFSHFEALGRTSNSNLGVLKTHTKKVKLFFTPKFDRFLKNGHSAYISFVNVVAFLFSPKISQSVGKFPMTWQIQKTFYHGV